MVSKIVKTIVVGLPFVLGSVFPILAEQTPARISSEQIVVRVDGASCPFCAFGLEKRLGQLKGVASVRLEMKDGEAIVTLKKGAKISEQALRQAVEDAGFTPGEIIFPAKP